MLLYKNADPNTMLTDGRKLTLCLANLMMDDELVLEGEWRLPFTVEKTGPLPAVELEHVRLPVEGLDHAEEADFEEIRVTSAGVELICDPQYVGFSLWSDVAVLLTDGTEVGISTGRGVWEGEAHESRWGGQLHLEGAGGAGAGQGCPHRRGGDPPALRRLARCPPARRKIELKRGRPVSHREHGPQS